MYILNTEINNNSTVLSGLQKIFGLGKNKTIYVCKKFGINSNTRIKFIDEKFKSSLIQFIETNYLITDKLQKFLRGRKTHLRTLRIYRGIRDLYSLPRRGQRSHTNAKTVKRIK